jgi:hypothetical protein
MTPAVLQPVRLLMLGIAALLLAACETVEDRIAANQPIFDGWDVEIQESLRAGEVKLGFTYLMAEIAFGAPDEVRQRTNTDGESSIWIYRYYFPVYDGNYFVGYRSYSVRGDGARRIIHIPQFRERYHYESEEYLRLNFHDGRISEIERTQY